MNIKFRLYNNETETTEQIQFNNVKNLNDGYRQLFKHILKLNAIRIYCQPVYFTCENLINISENNIDEYNFIYRKDFNFVMNNQEYEFNIMGYEIF